MSAPPADDKRAASNLDRRREALAKAERGGPAATSAGKADAADTEAADQEASDGPEGRGVSR